MRPIIKITDFTYPLPDERIAKFPLEKRDSSKLLVYKNGVMSDDTFSSLADNLPSDSFMVFNNTKVVPARLFFRKPTGAVIEILCLNPVSPKDYLLSFAAVGECSWRAVVGNAKKWKSGEIYFIGDENTRKFNFRAVLQSKGEAMESVVTFRWDTADTFSEILEACGQVPIPPYLNRGTEAIDKTRYQTIYAVQEGSVAAPTAGLHFTDDVLAGLEAKGIVRGDICLHVGAGTFVPVKSELIGGHKMHSEPFSVSKAFLETLLGLKGVRKVISVGTTSTRCLESLYYIGVHCIEGRFDQSGCSPAPVEQWEPYDTAPKYTLQESVAAILAFMESRGLDRLVAATSIIIVPGYEFKVVDIQITNFHQPQSTLLLLISALVGESWRGIYAHALEKGYRFLSYGDSSVLYR